MIPQLGARSRNQQRRHANARLQREPFGKALLDDDLALQRRGRQCWNGLSRRQGDEADLWVLLPVVRDDGIGELDGGIRLGQGRRLGEEHGELAQKFIDQPALARLLELRPLGAFFRRRVT